MNIGDKLHKLMLVSKISKKELAERSGVPLTTIDSMIRRKSKKVDCDTLKKLANALGIELVYFFSGTKDKSGISLSPEESDIIMKIRFLDNVGKDLIKMVLNHEVARVENIVNIKLEISTADSDETIYTDVDIDELKEALKELE